MNTILLKELLKQGNARTWTTFVNNITQFKTNTMEKLSHSDEIYVSMLANEITGSIASTLTEFYDNAFKNCNKITENKVQDKFNKIETTISQNSTQSISYQRDILDIYLLEKGYTGDTFALASNSLYNHLNDSATNLGNGLDSTLDTICNSYANTPQFEQEMAKN